MCTQLFFGQEQIGPDSAAPEYCGLSLFACVLEFLERFLCGGWDFSMVYIAGRCLRRSQCDPVINPELTVLFQFPLRYSLPLPP